MISTRSVNAIAAFFLCCALGACERKLPADFPKKEVDTGILFIRKLSDGDVRTAYALLSETQRGITSEENLKDTWNALSKSLGKFKAMNEFKTDAVADRTTIEFVTAFEKGTAIISLTFDPSGNIDSISMNPKPS